jgi:hypothetical protein
LSIADNRPTARKKTLRQLHSVVDEYIVFVAGGAGGALQAAKEEDGRAQRHQEGEGVCGDREPLKQAIHTQ